MIDVQNSHPLPIALQYIYTDKGKLTCTTHTHMTHMKTDNVATNVALAQMIWLIR